MKISFVIPAYNEECYIGKCIDSVLADIKNCPHESEIIVVNNASTDCTKEIAFARKGIILIDETNKGLTKARQAGYKISTGDIVANVDSDNILPAGWTTRVCEEFERNTKLVGLSGPLYYYDLPAYVNLQVKIFYFLGYFTYLVNHFIFRKGGMLQGGNFIIRKTALDQIGGYDTKIEFYGEDTDIARRLQKIGLIKFTFDLPMLSSGRRLAKEGVFNAGLRYALNYFWVLIWKKPFSKDHVELFK